jgi:UDP-N-acetylmuramoyl-L-alanyl-D-glutamate--2,6-diaminopimelate ligase
LKITELMQLSAAPPSANPTAADPTTTDPEITGLTVDSRQVRAGFLFAAWRGAQTDGRHFAAEAVAKGATAILTDDAAALNLNAETRRRVAIVTDPNPQRRLALAAARFYGRQPKTIAAVTGTNGKTSVAHFTRELWAALGHKAASLGTLGLVTPEGRRAGSLTTPDSVALHRDLAELAVEGIDHAAVEASSHGLDQCRLDGVEIAAAAFTNLTRDHLDYHQTMEAYRTAKERLFAVLLPPRGAAILNAHSDEFARLAALCKARGQTVIAYGAADVADLRIAARNPHRGGQALSLDLFGARHEIALPLVGEFQAMNALAALGLAVATGSKALPAAAALEHLSPVPGRLQFVGEPNRASVFVDYAHTPDALATVLTALRPHAERRLVIVFGAGGDRDRGKRPQMGRVATELADRVYVTDDNPRTENAADIRRAILDAAPGGVEIGDRRAAIAAAVGELGHGDVLVIAGKGHESGQIVGTETLPFDDVEVAREVMGQ